MTIELYVENVPADVTGAIQLPIERGPGNFILFQSSTAPVTLTLMYDGVREVWAGAVGGIYIRRIKPWTNMRVDGAIGTQVTYWVGTEHNAKDETDIRVLTASLAGTIQTADAPAGVLNATAGPTAVAHAAAVTVPANANRRRITISSIDSNPGFLYIQSVGAAVAQQGIPIGPGQSVVVRGKYAFDVRNDNAAAQSFTKFEEQ